jgi:hypothetical protein
VWQLVWWVETGELEARRHEVWQRLRELSVSESFVTLPDDLRQRIQDIVGAEEVPRRRPADEGALRTSSS